MWFLLLMLCPTNAEKNPFLLEQPPAIEPSGQTKVHLECRSDGVMSVTLAFCQAFCGTIQTNQCHYQGDGSNMVKLNLPLYGCGTIQDPEGTYKTNLTVKFYPCHYHGGMKSDEIITTICHYNITATTSTTETSTFEASTTTPDDAEVIENPGRSDDLVDPKDDSNITINIQQSSVIPWLIGILALIVLLSMLACCIYFASKRRIKFIQSNNSNSGLIATKSESHLSSDSMDNTKMMVKSNVETQTEEKNGMKRAKLDLEGEQLLKAQEQILTTILESTETETMETLERSRNIPIQLDSSQRIDNDLSYSYGERNGFEAQMDFHQEEEEESSAIASQEAAFYHNAHALKTTSFMR